MNNKLKRIIKDNDLTYTEKLELIQKMNLNIYDFRKVLLSLEKLYTYEGKEYIKDYIKEAADTSNIDYKEVIDLEKKRCEDYLSKMRGLDALSVVLLLLMVITIYATRLSINIYAIAMSVIALGFIVYRWNTNYSSKEFFESRIKLYNIIKNEVEDLIH